MTRVALGIALAALLAAAGAVAWGFNRSNAVDALRVERDTLAASLATAERHRLAALEAAAIARQEATAAAARAAASRASLANLLREFSDEADGPVSDLLRGAIGLHAPRPDGVPANPGPR